MTAFTESIVEQASLDWLRALGWAIAHGREIAPDQPGAERAHYGQVILEGRLSAALVRL
jgi:type I restriction enzyme R subunit